MDMQYMAYWLNGDGTQDLLEPDLPLRGVKVTREMNGLGRLTASLPPEWGRKTTSAGVPVIREWATAIYVEIAGDCFDGFIVSEVDDDNDKLSIDAVGWVGYADNQPWPDRTSSAQFNKGNVLASEVITTIWSKVQKPFRADLGMRVDVGGSWPRIGNPIEDELPVPKPPGKIGVAKPGPQPKSPSYSSNKKKYAADRKAYNAKMKTWNAKKKAYDKAKQAYEERKRKYEADKKERARMFEDAKIKMNYWSTHDLLSEFQQLSSEVGFSYRVDHKRSGNTHTHTLRCRSGRLGVRRPTLKFIEGENVFTVPKVTRQGDEKVTSAVILGSGEGSSMLWLQKTANQTGRPGLRRARVFADKTLTRTSQLDARAKEVLNAYIDPIEIEEFTVIDHGLAPFRTFDVGDEIELQTLGRRAGNFKRWVIIQSISLDPEKNVTSVKVVPVEQL